MHSKSCDLPQVLYSMHERLCQLGIQESAQILLINKLQKEQFMAKLILKQLQKKPLAINEPIYILNLSQNRMSNDNKQTQSCITVNHLFIVSLLSLFSSATLIGTLYIWGYMGFMGTSSLSVTDCNSQYHISKYSDLTLINQIAFSGSALAAVSSIIAFFLCVCLLVKKCKQDCNNNQISQCHRGALYVFDCLSIMGSAVVTGYYLTYILQANNCTFNYDITQLIVLIVLAVSALLWSLFMFFIVLFFLQDKQEGFKEIQPQQIQEIQHKISRQFQPNQVKQKQPITVQAPQSDQQGYLKDQRKKYLNSYNSRAPILLAQSDPYEQRQRDKKFVGRVRKNHFNESYDERGRGINSSLQYHGPLRNLEPSYYDQPLEDEPVFDLSYFYKERPQRKRLQSSSIMRNTNYMRNRNQMKNPNY